jgi:aspartate aminotransferase-like enzyme
MLGAQGSAEWATASTLRRSIKRSPLTPSHPRSIPGPIEFSDEVLYANATPGTSHVSPAFVPVFGDCLRMLKTVLYAEKGEGNQAMLIAGSGTLGWDSVGANLIERGDDAVSKRSRMVWV